jgi:hypothetical protein
VLIKPKLKAVCSAVAVLMMGCGMAAVAASPAGAKSKQIDPTRTVKSVRYRHNLPIFADLQISPKRGQWQVRLVGGGDGGDGAGMAADCEVLAVGKRTGRTIHARLVATLDSEDGSVLAYPAPSQPVTVTVVLTGRGADVDYDNQLRACPMRTKFFGHYHLVRPTRH